MDSAQEQLQTEQFKLALLESSLSKFQDARRADAQGLASRWMKAWVLGEISAKVICYIEQICNVEYKVQHPKVQASATIKKAAKKNFKLHRTKELMTLGNELLEELADTYETGGGVDQHPNSRVMFQTFVTPRPTTARRPRPQPPFNRRRQFPGRTTFTAQAGQPRSRCRSRSLSRSRSPSCSKRRRRLSTCQASRSLTSKA